MYLHTDNVGTTQSVVIRSLKDTPMKVKILLLLLLLFSVCSSAIQRKLLQVKIRYYCRDEIERNDQSGWFSPNVHRSLLYRYVHDFAIVLTLKISST